ncbi:MAG: ASCH domain-containing protein [Patescibacteria group bacterium]|nr:ASCH domain-containing protein [Patescibacteria group bacterium]
MKALSLVQPWASLVALGCKRIETRSWATRYRGEIAIHASKRWTRDERDLCSEEPFARALYLGMNVPSASVVVARMPLGAIVVVAHLIDVLPTDDLVFSAGQLRSLEYDPDDGYFPVGLHEADFGNYQPGRFAWLLSDVRRLPEPIPCKGALNLWEVPPDVEARIREALR